MKITSDHKNVWEKIYNNCGSTRYILQQTEEQQAYVQAAEALYCGIISDIKADEGKAITEEIVKDIMQKLGLSADDFSVAKTSEEKFEVIAHTLWHLTTFETVPWYDGQLKKSDWKPCVFELNPSHGSCTISFNNGDGSIPEFISCTDGGSIRDSWASEMKWHGRATQNYNITLEAMELTKKIKSYYPRLQHLAIRDNHDGTWSITGHDPSARYKRYTTEIVDPTPNIKSFFDVIRGKQQ